MDTVRKQTQLSLFDHILIKKANLYRSSRVEIAIYAPMTYTVLYILFLMLADPLRGQVGGGWALEIETFSTL
jgi:hypothetical protein